MFKPSNARLGQEAINRYGNIFKRHLEKVGLHAAHIYLKEKGEAELWCSFIDERLRHVDSSEGFKALLQKTHTWEWYLMAAEHTARVLILRESSGYTCIDKTVGARRGLPYPVFTDALYAAWRALLFSAISGRLS